MRRGNLVFYFIGVPAYTGLIVILFRMGNIADLLAVALIVLGVICLSGAVMDLGTWFWERMKLT